MSEAPLIICHRYEKAHLQKLFPPPCKVAAEGEALAGFPASVLLVTKNFNVNSDWFREVAMLRIMPDSEVLRLAST